MEITGMIPHFKIKENSRIARLAALKLHSKQLAIVIGNTIHLHHVAEKDFLKDRRWFKHELCHIDQFRRHGFIPFLLKYIYESIRSGYYGNKYEKEAREAELLD